ncbi:MAG: hypothetical protein M1834_003976 [Cirrosporium novae-zelandiae]|nr:MAG: hypothetical protein M1834_003976 [Cirrosporium novae-zelandiae]
MSQVSIGGFQEFSLPEEIRHSAVMWGSSIDTGELPAASNVNPSSTRRELLKRYEYWRDPVIHDIISRAELDLIYLGWTIPELPTWGTNGIVIVGDATHALSPQTGQGASQALEDTQPLAFLLAHYVSLTDTATDHSRPT